MKIHKKFTNSQIFFTKTTKHKTKNNFEFSLLVSAQSSSLQKDTTIDTIFSLHFHLPSLSVCAFSFSTCASPETIQKFLRISKSSYISNIFLVEIPQNSSLFMNEELF